MTQPPKLTIVPFTPKSNHKWVVGAVTIESDRDEPVTVGYALTALEMVRLAIQDYIKEGGWS